MDELIGNLDKNAVPVEHSVYDHVIYDSSTVEFVSFKLKKGVSEQDFLPVSDKFNSDFLAKQKGYISRKLLTKGEMWADLVVWETEEDFQAAMETPKEDSVAKEYLSLLNLSAKGSFFHFFAVEKSYD